MSRFDGHGWFPGFGFAWSLLFWVLIIGFIVALAKWLGSRQPRQDRSLEILKERYARGEVSREEYEEKKRDLTS